MIITTTDMISDHEVQEILGIVSGSSIRGTTYIKDAIAKFSDVFGGSSKGYKKELEKTTADAFKNLIEQAEEIGADAVIGVRINLEIVPTKSFGLFVLQCFGTAVKLKKEGDQV